MNDKEKRELATKMLKRNDYSDEEIEKILKHAFGDKKDKQLTTKKKRGNNA